MSCVCICGIRYPSTGITGVRNQIPVLLQKHQVLLTAQLSLQDANFFSLVCTNDRACKIIGQNVIDKAIINKPVLLLVLEACIKNIA